MFWEFGFFFSLKVSTFQGKFSHRVPLNFLSPSPPKEELFQAGKISNYFSARVLAIHFHEGSASILNSVKRRSNVLLPDDRIRSWKGRGVKRVGGRGSKTCCFNLRSLILLLNPQITHCCWHLTTGSFGKTLVLFGH